MAIMGHTMMSYEVDNIPLTLVDLSLRHYISFESNAYRRMTTTYRHCIE